MSDLVLEFLGFQQWVQGNAGYITFWEVALTADQVKHLYERERVQRLCRNGER